MATPLFSLVYPTRDRPSFIENALKFLEHQRFDDFEVIVADNYSDPKYSCKEIVKQAGLKNIRYVHPKNSLDMVQNWNFAYGYTTGQYIAYFTDKMFLLPGTLGKAASLIAKEKPDIISWNHDSFTPEKYPNYFGRGIYFPNNPDPTPAKYSPIDALSAKAQAKVLRSEQSSKDYARGKICFGLYNRSLCEKIISASGHLFHDISPDYTSMILGLGLAESVFDLGVSGIVHLNTDLSNGGQSAGNEDRAITFLKSLSTPFDVLLNNMLVPGLYTSQHNAVVHDYLVMKKLANLQFDIDKKNWLVCILKDLYLSDRNWSSKQVEENQKTLFWMWVRDNCESGVVRSLERQHTTKPIVQKQSLIRCFLRAVLPQRWRTFLRKSFGASQYLILDSVFDILNIERQF